MFIQDHSFRYFTFCEYIAYVAASYKRILSDISSLVEGFHFENYMNVLLKVQVYDWNLFIFAENTASVILALFAPSVREIIPSITRE